jgi:hypothetical protein
MEAVGVQGLRDRRAGQGGQWLELVRSADLTILVVFGPAARSRASISPDLPLPTR